jgi:hypothetical protein
MGVSMKSTRTIFKIFLLAFVLVQSSAFSQETMSEFDGPSFWLNLRKAKVIKSDPFYWIGRFVIASERKEWGKEVYTAKNGDGYYVGVIVGAQYKQTQNGYEITSFDFLGAPRKADDYKIGRFPRVRVSKLETIVSCNGMREPKPGTPGAEELAEWREQAKEESRAAKNKIGDSRGYARTDIEIFDQTDLEETKAAVREGQVMSEEDKRLEKEVLEKMSPRQHERYWKNRILKMSVKESYERAVKK